MITQDDRLLSRLELCVVPDKSNPSEYHIQLDKAIKLLSDFDYVVPPARFEKEVGEVMQKAVVGKLPPDRVSIIIIAKALLLIGKLLSIDRSRLRDIALPKEMVLDKNRADAPG